MLPHLHKFNADFRPEWVTRRMDPQGEVRAACAAASAMPTMIPAIRTPLPGLYFACMSQVYPWDRGTNYAVEMGATWPALIDEDIRAGVVRNRPARRPNRNWMAPCSHSADRVCHTECDGI